MNKNNLNRYNSDILLKSLKIKNVDTISNTTSSLMPQKGGYLDATSSFMSQKGGYLNNNKNKDINQLMSMLSATSESNYTTNSTNTEEIKNKLLNIVQDGGGRREEYKELENTFKLFNEYTISLNVKSLEYWKIIKHSGFEDKIISILNNLHLRDKIAFLENEIRMFLLTNQEILMNHPILLLIYNNIMSKIIDKSDLELNEIIQQITKELYEQISKIINHYLINPPKQTDDDKRQDPLYYFYDMLTNTRNNIEQKLISYIRLPRSATAVASSSIALPLPRSAASSSTSPLPRSLPPTSYTSPALPYSLPPAPPPRSSASASSVASSSTSLLPPGSLAPATMTANESERLYKQQMDELKQLLKGGKISGEEYFDTKLALSQLALSNGIPRNRVSDSILEAIDNRPKNDPERYINPKTGERFRIVQNRNLSYSNSIGPIYKRIYADNEGYTPPFNDPLRPPNRPYQQ